MSNWTDQFVSVYNNLAKDNLDDLAKIYHQRICFIDPVHEIHGLDQLTNYFEHMYENLISCDFTVQDSISTDNQAAIYWTMVLRHKKIKGGKEIKLEGHSKLKRHQDKIIYHRDYFDIGAMVYQHLPIVGGLIRFINRKMSQY